MLVKRAKKTKTQGREQGNKAAETTQSAIKKDSRFNFALSDPAFRKPQEKNKKIEIDKRFSSMFSNKHFGSRPSKVDKFGRPLPNEKLSNKELQKVYTMEEEGLDIEESESEEILPDDEDERLSIGIEGRSDTPKKGEREADEKSEGSSSTEVNEEIIEKLLGEYGPEGADFDEETMTKLEKVWDTIDPQEEVVFGVATEKLAVSNYDWSAISASDLMLLFASFCPTTGFVKTVSVYQSKFGKDRMKIEEEMGPVGIFKDEKMRNEPKNEKGLKEYWKQSEDWVAKQEENYSDLDPVKLRLYEKERMRYFFAVAEFDSKETADHVYEEINGKEFELLGIHLDLSFVQPNTKFQDAPKEVCQKVPEFSKVNNALNRAVSHTNVRLTWEEDVNRFEHLKAISEKEMEKLDLKDYLASASEDDHLLSDEDSEEPRENTKHKVERQREKLVEELKAKAKEAEKNESRKKKKNRRFGQKESEEEELEISFAPGLSEMSDKIRDRYEAKKREEKESAFEKFNRKRMEKKKLQKEEKDKRKKGSGLFVEEEEDEEDSELEREKLSLLVPEKQPKKTEEDVLELIKKDKRMEKLYTDPRFHIDPTSKDFEKRKAGNIMKLQVEGRKKLEGNKIKK